MDAVIENNKAYCPFCEVRDYRVGQPKQTIEGTQITAICNNCNREFEYLVQIKVGEDNIRFVDGGEE